MRSAWAIVGTLFVAVATVGWLDPSAVPREAARLYADGKFGDAATKYNQALTDAPDSTLLHFNLGDAEYRGQKYDEAARAFQEIPENAAAEYNRGNALFRAGEQLAAEKPQDALQKWAEALVAYRRTIATDPKDEDAKFNYEWVSRKIDELRKKLEDQKQQQNQQQQNQQKEQQQQGEQQQKEQQQKEQQQKEQQQEGEQQQKEQQQGEQRQQGEQQQQRQGAQGEQSEQGEKSEAGGQAPPQRALSRDEATALLDGDRNEELRPEDMIRRQLGTGGSAVQDW